MAELTSAEEDFLSFLSVTARPDLKDLATQVGNATLPTQVRVLFSKFLRLLELQIWFSFQRFLEMTASKDYIELLRNDKFLKAIMDLMQVSLKARVNVMTSGPKKTSVHGQFMRLFIHPFGHSEKCSVKEG